MKIVGSNSIMKLINIIEEINDKLIDERCSDFLDYGYVSVSYKYKHYSIDVEVDDNDNVEVIVTDRSHYHREYPNVETFISKYIVSWYDMDNEKNRRIGCYECDGFSNEADYLRYKYG